MIDYKATGFQTSPAREMVVALQGGEGFQSPLGKGDRNQIWDLLEWMLHRKCGGVIWCEFMEIHMLRLVKVWGFYKIQGGDKHKDLIFGNDC